MLNIERFEKSIHQIPKSTNYWLVRTEGGLLYTSFISQNVIALGYPEMSVDELRSLSGMSNRKEPLINLLKEKKYERRANLAATQLLRFAFEMKEGDFVVITSFSSNRIMIGQLSDSDFQKGSVVVQRPSGAEPYETFFKIRKVSWIKEIPRRLINPNLFSLFFSHHSIANANDYSHWIDTLLHDFYAKDKYYLVADVQSNRVQPYALFSYYSSLIELAKSFCELNGIPFDVDDFELSINLNSPGKIVFAAGALGVVLIIGAISVSISGGKFGFDSNPQRTTATLETKGLVSSVNEFLNDSERRNLTRVLAEKLEKLDIKKTEELVKLLETSDGN